MHMAVIVAQSNVSQRQVLDEPTDACDLDHVAGPDLVLEQQEEAGEVILHELLRAEAHGNAEDTGRPEDRRKRDADFCPCVRRCGCGRRHEPLQDRDRDPRQHEDQHDAQARLAERFPSRPVDRSNSAIRRFIMFPPDSFLADPAALRHGHNGCRARSRRKGSPVGAELGIPARRVAGSRDSRNRRSAR